MVIQDWAVVTDPDPFTAPELKAPMLYGEVYGHPRFADGKCVRTSRIVSKTEYGEVVTESGSVYRLGAVNPAYELKFPGAEERLLESLEVGGNETRAS